MLTIVELYKTSTGCIGIVKYAFVTRNHLPEHCTVEQLMRLRYFDMIFQLTQSINDPTFLLTVK
jgi:hypothetical protein